MKSHILCAGPAGETADRFASALARVVDGWMEVGMHDGIDSLVQSARALREKRGNVPLVFIIPAAEDDGASWKILRSEPSLAAARVILLGRLSRGQKDAGFDAILDPASTDTEILAVLRDQLTRHVIAHAPGLLDKLHPLLDLKMVAGALLSARENLIRLSGRFETMEDSVLGAPNLPDDELENAMIVEIDRLFDHPRRTRFEPGDMMLREGDAPAGIWVILEGRVELFRTVDGEDLVFHSETAGRIVGLMALYRQSPVFFSCRAKTPVVALYLSHEEIRTALHQSPEFASRLIGVILRSMARRNRRSAQLLTTVHTLNRKLAEQRDELERTLNELRAAQEKLVESEKMSTLGTLAAGMAHELNNPVAAILRATEYLESDLRDLMAGIPELKLAAAALPLAMERAPLSTREEREVKSALAESLGGDRNQAAALLAAGITRTAELDRLLALDPRADRAHALSVIQRGGQIGGALRNLGTCARRISTLVRSLKIYARDDQEWQEGVDLHQTLEDVLTLLANRIRDIDLHKEYGAIPPVTCLPSQLEQVWTNLLINAIQAMDGKGVIRIHTELQDDGMVGVTIEDHGPGIPPDVQPRLFHSRFTTRTDRVEFGLGLGLPISKTLVANHGGRISFQSRPGLTRFLVEIPPQPNTEP
jgi:two-component system, NtrC family, sensor kinase